MKIAVLIVLIAASASAGIVRLRWSPSPAPDVTYRVYGHTNTLTLTNASESPLKFDTGTNLNCEVLSVVATGRWYFAASAISDGVESELSNVLPVDFPASPSNLMTVAVEHALTVDGEFREVGLFRVRVR